MDVHVDSRLQKAEQRTGQVEKNYSSLPSRSFHKLGHLFAGLLLIHSRVVFRSDHTTMKPWSLAVFHCIIVQACAKLLTGRVSFYGKFSQSRRSELSSGWGDSNQQCVHHAPSHPMTAPFPDITHEALSPLALQPAEGDSVSLRRGWCGSQELYCTISNLCCGRALLIRIIRGFAVEVIKEERC